MPANGELIAHSNEELIKRFFAYMRAERGCSKNTIYNYGFDLSRLAEWLKRPLTSTQREDLSAYAGARLEAGISANSVARSIRCFRTFFRFLIDDEEMKHDPTIGVPIPRRTKTLPEIASQSDVDKMVASLGDSRLHIRDRAILLLLFGSGLRASELVDLRLDAIDLDAGIAKVWAGKGGKDGVVPLSGASIEAIKRYIADVRPVYAALQVRESSYLFLPSHGYNAGSIPLDRMTRQMLCYRINKISKDALGRRVYPHQLRHGFATVLVENDADISDVQALMRHSRVSTTQIYLHLDLKYLKEKYDASHPRARIADQNPGLFDSLPGSKPKSSFRPRLPSRPPRLREVYGAGQLPNHAEENPQLSAHA